MQGTAKVPWGGEVLERTKIAFRKVSLLSKDHHIEKSELSTASQNKVDFLIK